MKVTHICYFFSSPARSRTSYPPCFPSPLRAVGQATVLASIWMIFSTNPSQTCNTVIGTGGLQKQHNKAQTHFANLYSLALHL